MVLWLRGMNVSVERVGDAEIQRLRAHRGIEAVLDGEERHSKIISSERERLRPQIRIAIFSPQQPMVPESNFDAATKCPAGLVGCPGDDGIVKTSGHTEIGAASR